MENNITFKGMKNICGMTMQAKGRYNIPFLLVHLTGKDLEEFNRVLAKTRGKRFAQNADFVHISIYQDAQINKSLMVNAELYPEKDENLRMFSYIAQLTRKIAGMKDSEFVVNKDFKYGQDGDTYLTLGTSISQCIRPEYLRQFLNDMFAPKNCREFAQDINDSIHRMMNKYLGIR